MAAIEPPPLAVSTPSMMAVGGLAGGSGASGIPFACDNASNVLPTAMPGLMPMRLRTPSGKTAVFYAATGSALGMSAANVMANPGSLVHAMPLAPLAEQMPRGVAEEHLEGGMVDPSVSYAGAVPAVVPQLTSGVVAEHPMFARGCQVNSNIEQDCAEPEFAPQPTPNSLWSEQPPSAEPSPTAASPTATSVVETPRDCSAWAESECQGGAEVEPDVLASRTGEENCMFGDSVSSKDEFSFRRGKSEPQNSELRIGDIVYRQGQLASVVHVERELDPPSYVVRVAQTGCEVSCEREHLTLAFTSLGVHAEPQQHYHLQQQQLSSSPVAFADMVQMQHLQQQMLQQIDPRILEQHLRSAQHPQYAEHEHRASPRLEQHGLSEEQGAHEFHPWEQFGDFSHGQVGGLYPDDLHRLHQLRMAHESDPPGTSSNLVDVAHMQHFMNSTYSDQMALSSTGGGMLATGHVKNHALEALSEALDRAEVGMIMGGRHAANNVHTAGDEFSFVLPHADLPSSTNYALQAARQALGVADDGSSKSAVSRFHTLGVVDDLPSQLDASNLPLGSSSSTNFALRAASQTLPHADLSSSNNYASEAASRALGVADDASSKSAVPRFHALGAVDDLPSQLDPSNLPLGSSSSTNYALQAASQALGAIERSTKVHTTGISSTSFEDIHAQSGLALNSPSTAMSHSPIGGLLSTDVSDRTRLAEDHEFTPGPAETPELSFERQARVEQLDFSQERVHPTRMQQQGICSPDLPSPITPQLQSVGPDHAHAEQRTEPSSPSQFTSHTSCHQFSPILRLEDDEDEELELMAKREMEEDAVVDFDQLESVSAKAPCPNGLNNGLTPTPPPAPPPHPARQRPPSGGRHRPPSAGRRAPSVEGVARSVTNSSSRPKHDPQFILKEKLEKRDSLLNFVLGDETAVRSRGSTTPVNGKSHVANGPQSRASVPLTHGVRSRSVPPAPASPSSTTFASYNAPSHNKISQSSLPHRLPRHPEQWAPSSPHHGSSGPKYIASQDSRSMKAASVTLPSLRSGGGSGPGRTSQYTTPAASTPTGRGLRKSGSQSARNWRSSAKKGIALYN